MGSDFLNFSDLAILHFMIELKNEKDEIQILSGIKAVDELKSKLRSVDDNFGLKIADLDTLICQNDCSGHGYCKQETRTCVCESFWIENFVRRNLMDYKSNCGKFILVFFNRAGTVNRKTGLPNRTETGHPEI